MLELPEFRALCVKPSSEEDAGEGDTLTAKTFDLAEKVGVDIKDGVEVFVNYLPRTGNLGAARVFKLIYGIDMERLTPDQVGMILSSLTEGGHAEYIRWVVSITPPDLLKPAACCSATGVFQALVDLGDARWLEHLITACRLSASAWREALNFKPSRTLMADGGPVAAYVRARARKDDAVSRLVEEALDLNPRNWDVDVKHMREALACDVRSCMGSDERMAQKLEEVAPYLTADNAAGIIRCAAVRGHRKTASRAVELFDLPKVYGKDHPFCEEVLKEAVKKSQAGFSRWFAGVFGAEAALERATREVRMEAHRKSVVLLGAPDSARALAQALSREEAYALMPQLARGGHLEAAQILTEGLKLAPREGGEEHRGWLEEVLVGAAVKDDVGFFEWFRRAFGASGPLPADALCRAACKHDSYRLARLLIDEHGFTYKRFVMNRLSRRSQFCYGLANLYEARGEHVKYYTYQGNDVPPRRSSRPGAGGAGCDDC